MLLCNYAKQPTWKALMQLRLPFDAALVMNQTTLVTDYPEVWRRYLNNTSIAYGRQTGVRVLTKLGAEDLRCIRTHLSLWIAEQELIDDDLRDREARQLMWQANQTVGAIDEALRRAGVLESGHATADNQDRQGIPHSG